MENHKWNGLLSKTNQENTCIKCGTKRQRMFPYGFIYRVPYMNEAWFYKSPLCKDVKNKKQFTYRKHDLDNFC